MKVLVYFLFVCATCAIAEPKTDEVEDKAKTQAPLFGPGVTDVEPKDALAPGFSAGRYLSAMFFVIAICVLSLWGLHRLRGRMPSMTGGRGMVVQQRLQLDSRNALVLVQVHDQELLLAVGSHGVKQLASGTSQITDDDDNDDGLVERAASRAVPTVWSPFLDRES